MATAEVEERELLKAITWYDGFVVAMANPSFLITSLGVSSSILGGWGAFILWTTSVLIGTLHNYIYSETAAMFPKLSGGIAIYAHEAWKRYLSLVGPVAAFGYWIGWSVVLSATGFITGLLVQAQWYTSSIETPTHHSAWNHSSSVDVGIGSIPFYFSFPLAFTVAIIVIIWGFNVLGIRPAMWVGYVTGALLLIPLAVFIFLPYVTGDWHSSNLHSNIHWTSSVTGDTGIRLVLVWLYIMCWSSYGFECCATFAPEYKDTVNDTPKALRTAAIFSALVYALLPLGAIGTIGDQNLNAGNYYSFYAQGFDTILGGGADIAIILLIAGIILAMNTATADGSRALYGIAQDDMTIKQLGKLNRFHVPGNAMTVDAVLNIILLFTFASDAVGAFQILVFSNLGYVLCHCFAMSGFILLRRDRPEWPRPLRLNGAWVAVAGVLAAYDTLILIVGALSPKLSYGVGYKTTVVGLVVLAISVALYFYRVIVQDKKKFQWRLPPATVPEEEAAIAPVATV
jgi:amino acid transporter